VASRLNKRPGLAGLAIFAAAAIGCGEIHEEKYESASEIMKLGLDKAGSIFFEVPLAGSAFSIQYAADIDTNEIWVAYSYSRDDSLSNLTVACTTRRDLPGNMVRRRPANWWPVDLLKARGSENFRAPPGYEMFQCGEDGWLVVNTQNCLVAYYRSGS